MNTTFWGAWRAWLNEADARRCVAIALWLHGLLGAAVLAFLVIVRPGPSAPLEATGGVPLGFNEAGVAASLALTWLLVGVILLLAYTGKVTRSNAITVAGMGALALLHLALASTRIYFGDYRVYVKAAESIVAGTPFHGGYLYPPMLASVLAWILRLFGSTGASVACFVINQTSIWAFFILASLFLKRCGLSLRLSSLLVFCAAIVNVPIIENTVYVQMNLAALDLVLASVLLVERSQVLSAAFLAVGIHLKVAPVLLTPVFVSPRRRLWLGALIAIGAAIAVVTSVTDGASYYRDSFNNLRAWQSTRLQSVSIDSLLANVKLHGVPGLPLRPISLVLKVALAGWIYFLAWLSVRRKCFVDSGREAYDTLLNGILPLFFLATVVSPAVWVHHLVVLIIPAIAIIARLRTPVRVLAFALAYFATFLLPVITSYPWAYLRLAGWLVLLVLMSDVILKPVARPWIRILDERLNTALGDVPSSQFPPIR